MAYHVSALSESILIKLKMVFIGCADTAGYNPIVDFGYDTSETYSLVIIIVREIS